MHDHGSADDRVALVVEDEPTLSSLVCEALGMFGWKTLSASTVREVDELVQDGPFDIILADVRLADGSTGFDAINHVWESVGDVRAVVMSGGVVEAIREQSRQLLGEEVTVLQKPFSIAELRAAIE